MTFTIITIISFILLICFFFFILEKKKKKILFLQQQIIALQNGIFKTIAKDFNFESARIVEAIRDLETEFISQAEEKDLNLNLKIYSSPNTLVTLDIDAFKEVMRQLLKNAIKYASSTITLTLTTNKELQQCIITLSDDGCGIPPEDHQKIFKPFYQKEINQQPIEGCGIGLTLVKEYILRLGGALQLNSNLNEGTTFILTFAYDDENTEK